jgi:hypothetical protein
MRTSLSPSNFSLLLSYLFLTCLEILLKLQWLDLGSLTSFPERGSSLNRSGDTGLHRLIGFAFTCLDWKASPSVVVDREVLSFPGSARVELPYVDKAGRSALSLLVVLFLLSSLDCQLLSELLSELADNYCGITCPQIVWFTGLSVQRFPIYLGGGQSKVEKFKERGSSKSRGIQPEPTGMCL